MINLIASAKCKSPKGRKVDLSGDTDDDLLMSFQSGEAQWQQKIDGTEE
jgi:hypothetical protein